MAIKNPLYQHGYQIGEAAKRSGVAAANIRFYEKENLIPARGTNENNYRVYNDNDLHQLRFIRVLRSMDMSLEEIRSFLHLDLRNKKHCETARDVLDHHLAHVRTRLKELRGLEKELSTLRLQCDGQNTECRLIEALHARAHTEVPKSKKSRVHTHV